VSPHVVGCSPFPISSILREGVNVDGILEG
jgi:hypothetical protein